MARARSTQVLYDHAADHKLAITEAWFDQVAAIQGTRPARR